MSLHLSANDMSDYMGFSQNGSPSLHIVPQPAFRQRQQTPPVPPRPINILPTKKPEEIHQPYQNAHSASQNNTPTARSMNRQPPQTSLLAARKAAMTKAVEPPVTATTAPTVASLLGPRLDHVEKAVKEVCQNITMVDDNQTKLEKVFNVSWLVASVAFSTTEYLSTDDDYNKVIKEILPTPVAANQKVSVTYPMVEVKVGNKPVYLMRRRFVDSDTAEVGGSWIVVYEPSLNDEDDVSFVNNFSFW